MEIFDVVVKDTDAKNPQVNAGLMSFKIVI
jgi:hypothetical protein